uniref:Rhamnan synthesis protein F n=1 Tax=viral metagenome TaxID=1070528 RepID=A0A6C0AGT4_9ZZZZ
MNSILEEKFLVIYVYYEIKNYQKNQSNLSFFITHGLNKKNWMNLNIEYLFVLHGFCEVLIPNEKNIFILKEDNCSDWEGWANGIQYIEKKFNLKNISDKYDYIYFMNCSITGPFIEANLNSHWLLPYYKKIKEENSIVCSNIITSLPENDLGGPGLRISCYNYLLKIDEKIIDILINEKIINKHEFSKNKDKIEIYLNTVFGKKRDKIDAALTGEYGLSRILIKNKYKLSSLLYDSIDYNNILNNNLHQDRYLSFNGKNLPVKDMIFYKNIWRWENYRVCPPVEYQKCFEFIKIQSNFEIFKFSMDYKNLKCNEKGITLNNRNYNWNSKEEFYKKHGYAEEIIVFPIQKINNESVCIYHHYDSDNIIKDYVLQGLKCLIESKYDIYFCTSCEKIENVDLPFEIHYFKNYGAGTDFIFYYEIIKKNIDLFKLKYKYLLFTNDSVIFPINGIEQFQKIIQKQREKSDIWGHWNSQEIQLHFVGTLIELKIDILIDAFFNFLNLNIKDYETSKKDKMYYIFNVEVKLLEYFKNLGYKTSSILDYKKFNYIGHISPFNPDNFYKWLKDPDCFAIKWKYMCNYINLEYFKNPNLNYLLRYLHFGPNGPIGNYEKDTHLNPGTIINFYK